VIQGLGRGEVSEGFGDGDGQVEETERGLEKRKRWNED